MQAKVFPYVFRAYSLSEPRTPIICCLAQGDPLASIEMLAKEVGSVVWKMPLDCPGGEQNAIDYLSVGIQNGDWLYLTKCEAATMEVFRKIGAELFALTPDKKAFPRRHLFRLWLAVEEPVDLNDRLQCLFPPIFTQNALLAWFDGTENKSKVICKEKVDPELAGVQVQRRSARRDKGRDSDDESDDQWQDPAKRLTGMWFHPDAVTYSTADDDNVVTRSYDDIFDSIERGDVDQVKAILARQVLDINDVSKSGLNPLMWAVLCDNIPMVRLLLESDADPNLPRKGNDMPAIFLPLEDPQMLQLLVDFGANIDARYQGMSLLEHPDTSLQIIEYLTKRKKN